MRILRLLFLLPLLASGLVRGEDPPVLPLPVNRPLQGHIGVVSALAFSPDGKYLVTVCLPQRQVYLWNAATGELLDQQPVAGRTSPARRLVLPVELEGLALAVHPTKSRFAVAAPVRELPGLRFEEALPADVPVYEITEPGEGRPRLREATRLRPTAKTGVAAVAFSPDGQVLAGLGRSPRLIHFWDAQDRETTRVRDRPSSALFPDSFRGFAFTGDGKALVGLAADGTARVWDAATGELRQSNALHPPQTVPSLALPPQGTHVATLGKGLKVWDRETGKEIATAEVPDGALVYLPDSTLVVGTEKTISFRDPKLTETRSWKCNGPVRHLAGSRDGKLLASVQGTEVVVQALPEGSEVCRLPAVVDSSRKPACWSGDGKTLITVVPPGGLALWDAGTGRQRRILPGVGIDVHRLACTPSADRIFVSGVPLVAENPPGGLCILDGDTGRLRATVPGAGDFYPFEPTPDGKRFLSHSGTRLALWDADTGQLLQEIPAEGGPFTQSPDGTTVAVFLSDPGTPPNALRKMGSLRVLDLTTGEVLSVLEEHIPQPTALAFRAAGKTLAILLPDTDAGKPASRYLIWDPVTGRVESRPPIRGSWDRSPEAVRFCPDPRWLITGRELIDLDSGRSVRSLKGATYWGISPDGREVFTNPGPICSLGALQIDRVLEAHTGPVWSVIYAPDGSWVATGSPDGTVRITDPTTGTEKFQLDPGGPVHALAIERGGRKLAVASGPLGGPGTLTVWDPTTGGKVATFPGQLRSIRALAFRPDGKTLAVATDTPSVLLIDATTGKLEGALPAPPHQILALAFRPDGTELVGAGFGIVHVWDPVTRKEKTVLRGHVGQVRALAYHPAGDLLASVGHDGDVRLWSVPAGKLERTLKATGEPLAAVAFSPDGKHLAVAESAQGTANSTIVYDTASGAQRFIVNGQESGIRALAFRPDGRQLATASLDRTTRLWRLPD
jgi:WD40 repeat protein